MTKQSSTLSQAILKNIDTRNVNTGMGVTNLIVNMVNEDRRRAHLAGGVKGFAWDRDSGIGLLMDDAGQMIHLANALSLTEHMKPRPIDGGRLGTGYGRTGIFAGFTVTVWYVEI